MVMKAVDEETLYDKYEELLEKYTELRIKSTGDNAEMYRMGYMNGTNDGIDMAVQIVIAMNTRINRNE